MAIMRKDETDAMETTIKEAIRNAIIPHAEHAKSIPGFDIMASIVYETWLLSLQPEEKQTKKKPTKKEQEQIMEESKKRIAKFGSLELFTAHDRKCFPYTTAISSTARPVSISKRLYRLKKVQDEKEKKALIEKVAQDLERRRKRREKGSKPWPKGVFYREKKGLEQ
jgi:hypothetical protein